MRSVSKLILSVLIISTSLVLIAYGAGYFYFRDHLFPRTQVMGIAIGGDSIETAEEKLHTQLQKEQVTLTENNQEVTSVSRANLLHIDNIKMMISTLKNKQNPTQWPIALFSSNSFSADELTTEIEPKQLEKVLADKGISNESRTAAQAPFIERDSDGQFVISAQTPGNQINWETLSQAVETQDTVALDDHYLTIADDSNYQKLNNQLEKLKGIADTKITLEIGQNTETLPSKEISKWLYVTEIQEIAIDQEAIANFLIEYNNKYATINKTRTLESTYSGTVSVQPRQLGWSIDRYAEAAQIAEELWAMKDVKRPANIVGNHLDSGLEIGVNYIEIDLNVQRLMIYRDNELAFETPIISGSPKSPTPVGAVSVWNKELDSTLIGEMVNGKPKYKTPVDYWMPIDSNNLIGIHDASWQSNFGGDSYLSHGSNGCINVSPQAAATIWQLVEIGMPTYVF